MKKKTRTIVISDCKYVWWHKIKEDLLIIVSPFNDKTSTVSISFPCKHNNDNLPQAAIGSIPERIILQNNDINEAIEVLSPKLISILIEHLSSAVFNPHSDKQFNGIDLLKNLGYTITDIKYRMYW